MFFYSDPWVLGMRVLCFSTEIQKYSILKVAFKFYVPILTHFVDSFLHLISELLPVLPPSSPCEQTSFYKSRTINAEEA